MRGWMLERVVVIEPSPNGSCCIVSRSSSGGNDASISLDADGDMLG